MNLIKPEFFYQYLQNAKSLDTLKKFGYDNLPSFYFNRNISNVYSLIENVTDKYNEYSNILKNTANFKQYPVSGYVEATPKKENPRPKTLENISDFNILSSYLNKLQQLYTFKNQTGYGMIYFNNPHQLLKRLELLGGSILAGNNGVINEFSKIAHILNQMKVITKKQLNNLIKTYITNR